jgi:uncharacterized protein (UPF0333 family)
MVMIMKAQIGMEYILMFSISLTIAGLIWIYASSDIETTKWDLQMAYAKDAVNRITETADMMYIQGPPAQSYINPVFPDNIKNTYLSGNTVTLELLWKEGILRNISADASVNLTGNLVAAPGTHRILIRANNTNVEIRDG